MADSIEKFYEKDGSLCYDNEETTQFTVTYKGDLSDLADVKYIEISYETPSESGSNSTTFNGGSPRRKTFTSGTCAGTNCALLRKDDIIKMTVNIDGKIETMELKVK